MTPGTEGRAVGPVGAVREHLGNPLHRNAYLLMLNHAASAALGVAYWVLVARLYDAETVGRNAALIATLMFLAMVAQVGLKDALTRFVAGAGDRAARLVARAYAVVLACSFVMGAAWVGVETATGGLGGVDHPGLAIWLIVGVAGTSVFYVQDGVLSGLRRPGLVLIENGLYNVAKIVVLVLLADRSPTYGILVSWTAPMLLGIAWITWVLYWRLLPAERATTGDLPSAGTLGRWVVGDHLGALCTEAATRLLPLIVVHHLGDTENAWFYQAWVIAATLPLLAGSTMTSMIVESATRPREIATLARRAMVHQLRIVVPLGVAGILLAPWILRVFGKDYADNGTATLRWLLLAIVPQVAVIWYLGYARAANLMRRVVAMQAVAAVVTLTVAWALVPDHGIQAAAIAWVLGQAAAAVVALAWGRAVLFPRDPLPAGPRVAAEIPGKAASDR